MLLSMTLLATDAAQAGEEPMSAAQIACDRDKVELARLMEREILWTPGLDKAESNREKGKAHSLTFIANSDRKANWARWMS